MTGHTCAALSSNVNLKASKRYSPAAEAKTTIAAGLVPIVELEVDTPAQRKPGRGIITRRTVASQTL